MCVWRYTVQIWKREPMTLLVRNRWVRHFWQFAFCEDYEKARRGGRARHERHTLRARRSSRKQRSSYSNRRRIQTKSCLRCCSCVACRNWETQRCLNSRRRRTLSSLWRVLFARCVHNSTRLQNQLWFKRIQYFPYILQCNKKVNFKVKLYHLYTMHSYTCILNIGWIYWFVLNWSLFKFTRGIYLFKSLEIDRH